MDEKEQIKMYEKINKFLKKKKGGVIKYFMEEQIKKQGYIDKLWYCTREGIICIDIEDIK